jgi:hypothetical protein
VRLQSEATAEPKKKEKRRGTRMNSRVPLVVEWSGDSSSEAFSEKTFTRVVGPYGCLLVLRHNLDVEQALRIVNLATNETNSAIIVWKGNERPDGWELGIELIHPGTDFWGLEL